MMAKQSGDAWQVQAPGKLNLFLEIVGRRQDGFHQLETLMVPVDVYDTLRFHSLRERDIVLRCRWGRGLQNRPGLPAGESNLAVRAVRLLQQRAGVSRGAAIQLIKRVPIQSGMGGGSSDAAAALVAANVAWQLGWSQEELTEVAAEIGSDVPFFLAGGAAVCVGRGEQVAVRPRTGNLRFILVEPQIGLSTADVYSRFRMEPHRQALGRLLAALENGRTAGAGQQFYNSLKSPAEQLAPQLREIDRALGWMPLPGHGLTGSGSSYFGLCRHARQARRLAGQLRSRIAGNVRFVANRGRHQHRYQTSGDESSREQVAQAHRKERGRG